MALLPRISKSDFNRLEKKFLTLLDFTTGISVQQYTSYYFKLRDLFKEVTGDCIDWEGKPLSIIGAKKLELIPQKLKLEGKSILFQLQKPKSAVVPVRADATNDSVKVYMAHKVQSLEKVASYTGKKTDDKESDSDWSSDDLREDISTSAHAHVQSSSSLNLAEKMNKLTLVTCEQQQQQVSEEKNSLATPDVGWDKQQAAENAYFEWRAYTQGTLVTADHRLVDGDAAGVIASAKLLQKAATFEDATPLPSRTRFVVS